MKKAAIRAMIVLAAVVALSMFFSGTIRTLTTPKVRFLTPRSGKFEQVIEMTGKVFFPEEEEIFLEIPEDASLTLQFIRVQAGDRVQKGDPLFSAVVTDLDKTLDALQKEYDTARDTLRTQVRKNGEIRLSRNEQTWLDAYDASVSAAQALRESRLEMLSMLAGEGLALQGEELPEEASEELKKVWQNWREKKTASEEAERKLLSLERFALADSVWEDLSSRREQEAKMAEAEQKMTELTVLSRLVQNYPAPHDGYITALSLEKGNRLENGASLVKMTPEDGKPVLRTDTTQLKQTVAKGTAVEVVREEWDRYTTKVSATGISADASKYADILINDQILEGFASLRNLMKNEVKLRVTTRAQEATCLAPASAVRGTEGDRYVYVAQRENSTFGGNQIKAVKRQVTVLNESETTVSMAEDMSYLQIIYQEDRPLNDGDLVMAYSTEETESR